MKIQIEKEKVQAAYNDACGGIKEMLITLFGKEACETAKPTLDDYKTIKSYEDACEVLGLTPILSKNRNKAIYAQFSDFYDFWQNMPKHIVALMKLEIISRALWGKDFQPKPDVEGKEAYYYPCFALFTQKEVEAMDKKKRKSMLSASFGDHMSHDVGFGSLFTNDRSSSSNASLGFRLCQETPEKAEYFGKQFRNTSGNNSLSCGLNIWLTASRLQDT